MAARLGSRATGPVCRSVRTVRPVGFVGCFGRALRPGRACGEGCRCGRRAAPPQGRPCARPPPPGRAARATPGPRGGHAAVRTRGRRWALGSGRLSTRTGRSGPSAAGRTRPGSTRPGGRFAGSSGRAGNHIADPAAPVRARQRGDTTRRAPEGRPGRAGGAVGPCRDRIQEGGLRSRRRAPGPGRAPCAARSRSQPSLPASATAAGRYGAGQRQAAATAAAACSSSATSRGPKRAGVGLSQSSTATTRPPARRGTTTSLRDALSQAMWPGKA